MRAALQRVEGVFALVEPKSSTSRRYVPLPAIVLARLVEHGDRQAAEHCPVALNPLFADMLFTTTAGQPIDGISVTRRFQRILPRVGLPRPHFHDLRHACASLLLAHGCRAGS